MLRRVLQWVVASAGAAAIESYITIESGLAVPHDYLYGAPIAIGQCHNDSFLSLAGSCSFSPPLFVANILVTAVVLALAAELTGFLGLLAGIGGALLTVRAFPRAPGGAEDLLPLWLTTMAVGLVLGLATAIALRLGRRAAVGPSA